LARDEFTEVTKRKLRDNVSSRCSKPDCRVPTTAPSNSIGIAAHICAASKRGPRYDKYMTPLQRKSIDNAIWLCCNHATEIDKNPNNYSVELLKQWKAQAEEFATKELGIKLPSDTDAINMVTSALTGNPTQYISNAIQNIHKATEKSLEEIDSRFYFKTKYDESMTSVTCHAKEKINLSIETNRKHEDKWQNFFEHGKDFKIDSSEIKITGSKLFDELLNQPNGTITFSQEKKAAILKLWLVESKTGLVELFDDMHGLISFGSKSLNFNGCGFNGLFCIDVGNKKVTLSPSFEVWDGISLQSLPYFNKIFLLFSKLQQGWNMSISIEIYGEKLGDIKEIEFSDSEFIDSIYSFLKYTQNSRIISSTLNTDILFSSNIEYTSPEYFIIEKVVKILEMKEISYVEDMNSNPIINAKSIKGKEVEFIKNFSLNKPSSLRITKPSHETIKVFEKNIELPNKIMTFHDITTIIHTSIDKIKRGNEAKIELIPQKDFKYIESYELSDIM